MNRKDLLHHLASNHLHQSVGKTFRIGGKAFRCCLWGGS